MLATQMTRNDFKMGFLCGSDGKVSPAMQENQVDPLLERLPGEENDYPLQFFCLDDAMDRADYTVLGAATICTKYTLYISS